MSYKIEQLEILKEAFRKYTMTPEQILDELSKLPRDVDVLLFKARMIQLLNDPEYIKAYPPSHVSELYELCWYKDPKNKDLYDDWIHYAYNVLDDIDLLFEISKKMLSCI